MSDFFNMGGYGAYIWTSYGLTAVVLIGFVVAALRSLRIIHYAAWVARRWDDPAFKQAFPWFDSRRYWDEHVLALREQVALMQEPPLEWLGFGH